MIPLFRSLRLFLTCMSACFAVPAAAQEAANPPFPRLQWEPIFQGVSRTSFALTSPRPIRGVALKIDLQAKGISFLATPDNGGRDGETDGAKTTSFLKANHLQAAINAAPYSPVVSKEGRPEDVCGLHISEGKTVSPAPEKGYPALLITKDNRARIEGPPFRNLDNVWTAVCGFTIVLQKSKVIPGVEALHPRTAAGISADGRWLILLVVDGRQARYSGGAKTAEIGSWLLAMGCAEGINLDGGGTSTMVIEGRNGPQILNRPIHAGIPGNERVAGSHLGLRAAPLRSAR